MAPSGLFRSHLGHPPLDMSLHLTIPKPSDIAPSLGADRVTTPSDSEELNEFRQNFEKNMPSSQKPISHDSAAALLLSFDSEAKGSQNLDVKEEVNELGEVLHTDYDFEVENKVISGDEDAQSQALEYLSQFRRKYSKNGQALLIVYYAGHGWRSNDANRKKQNGFNLYGSTDDPDTFRQEPSEGAFIMWEVAENILHGLKCDVLVIFDCCDTGYLNPRGSRGRAFEYLGACNGRYTPGPGKESFTSALIWALKKLKMEAPFTTDTLKNTIKEHQHFPTHQQPVLFKRWDYLPEPIWISRMQMNSKPKTRSRGISKGAEFREEDSNFVDFRMFFNRQLSANDGKHIANMMTPLVHNRKYEFNARHVEVIQKGTCQVQTPKKLSDNWRKLWNTFVVVQGFRRQPDEEDIADERPHKRPRLSIEDDNIGGPSQVLEVIDVLQRPLTPVSEGPSSDVESTYHSRIQPGMKASSGALVQFGEIYSERGNGNVGRKRKPEELENDILRQTGREEVLLRVREVETSINKGP